MQPGREFLLHGHCNCLSNLTVSCPATVSREISGLFPDVFHVVTEQMQAGDPVVGAPMAVAGGQSRSEDEESLGVKDVKRTATQAFGSGVPKRRSSSRFESSSF